MKKILFHITRDMYPLLKDRHPYIYLEHGRLEVDDSSIKWISADNYVVRIPCAMISTLLLGPGTSITHAAVQAIGASGCIICWVGEESLSFYAVGFPPTADTRKLNQQCNLAFDPEKRTNVARKMFSKRFPGVDLTGRTIQSMMGMEGVRVRAFYSEMSEKYGIEWRGRSYVPGCPEKSDSVNRALTFFNGLLYGILSSAIFSAGYTPRIGFIHSGSPLPFTYDLADLYKSYLTVELAFKIVSEKVNVFDRSALIDAFCERFCEMRVLEHFVEEIDSLLSEA